MNLLPSRAYFDLGGRPYQEAGWDINENGEKLEIYSDYARLLDLLDNYRFRRSRPGQLGDRFHRAGQDDWSNDQSGIQYYHIYGVQRFANTIERVIAYRETVCDKSLGCKPKDSFQVRYTQGDRTVPLLSAERISGSKNLNAPGAQRLPIYSSSESEEERVEHTTLTRNPEVLNKILDALGSTLPPAQGQSNLAESEATLPPAQPAYYLRVSGAENVTIADDLSNKISLLSDVSGSGVPGVTSHLLGAGSLAVVMPIDKALTITLRSGIDPLAIELTKGTDTTTTEAIRYRDLMLPVGVTAMLRITSQGVESLRYDADKNGSFESVVNPTASVSGDTAQDVEAPTISFASSPQQTTTQVTISAADSGVGVKSVFYSLDGKKFQPYSGPLNLNLAQSPIIYAFAEDKVANRSSLITHMLGAPVVSVSAASYVGIELAKDSLASAFGF